MTDYTTKTDELSETQLNEVSGGNPILGIAGGILGNFIYDALTGRDGGGFVGGIGSFRWAQSLY